MYAIIETGGKQYWVVPGEILQIEKLPAEKGAEVTFKALWSASQEEKDAALNKSPSAKVTAKVIRHLKGPKVIVFRKKTKKAYERSIGHRQELTEIEVKEIQLA
ncbi:MAG: 50S ribosomal protein L21 [Elusimicrobia bacterium GWC2_51_8]|nr:MAG: 50S ribosomal protein L21 [Elusimicrobia bacterium GWA2_51_34]OGR65776.1 MAG: 50S ribosomal protein L21 [Elusimicrobia bacterium GWC2_51_8]OGR88514.1 MAG: 50S ribosomal protein L21 [Elusimicrobia bacterium GWF2_52_66]HAF95218.1 50S ribosomal protein L21 [Elusimicrobiota bacterium]HCE97146.1 50S ribosomal protein L21 [Elusimicrobiota bacterium]